MSQPIGPQHAVLLVMHMQPAALSSLAGPDELVAIVADAIAATRRLGGHVAYTRMAFTDSERIAFPAGDKLRGRSPTSGGGGV